MREKIIEKIAYKVRNNINFSSMFSDMEIGKDYSKIKNLVEKHTSECSISLNYIGEKGDKEIALLDKLIQHNEESFQKRQKVK